ncbi:MAG: hypothetical protein OHK0039_00640 [Bacteroidia bacterium]
MHTDPTTTPLYRYFADAGLGEAAAAAIASAFGTRTIGQGDYFLQTGAVCKHIAFVESGLFQHVVLTSAGDERTTYVATPGRFLASIASFVHQQPARESIRCIADGRLWQITRAELQRLLVEVAGFQIFYIDLLEYQLDCIEQSRFDFVVLSAEQRYTKMLAEEPHLLQTIPLQYLASILGITPRHLSRIRGKIR